MPDIYTVVIDGHELDLEGDRPPTESDARAALQSYMAKGARGLSGDPATREATRQQNMTKQSGVTTDPDAAYSESIGDTVSKTIGGVVRGAASMLDPRSYIEMAKTAKDAMLPTPDGLKRNMDRAQGFSAMVKNVASGDPEAGGEAIGQLATGLVVPRIAPRVPNAMVRTGEAMQSAATSPFVQRAVHPIATGVAGATGFSHGSIPGGIAAGLVTEAIPPVIDATGRGMVRAGRAVGGVSKSNAGGALVKAPQSIEDMLTEAANLPPEPVTAGKGGATLPPQPALTRNGQPSRSAIDLDIESARPEARTGRSLSGEEIAAQDGGFLRGRAYYPYDPKSAPGTGSFSTAQPVRSATADAAYRPVDVAPTPPAPPANPLAQAGEALQPQRTGKMSAAPAVEESALAKSELQKQLEASLQARQGAVPVDALPADLVQPTTSKSARSATTGLTEADMAAIGKDPTVPLRYLTFDEIAKIREARATRHASHYESAVSEAAAKRSVARGRPGGTP